MTKNTTLWTKNFILLFLNGFFMSFGFMFLLPTLPVFAMERLSANPSHIGYLLSAYSLAAMIARPYAGYTYDTLGKKKTYLVSLAVFTLISFVYPLAGTFVVLLLLRLMHGLAFGVATTGISTIIADVVPAERRGEGMGFFGLSNTLSMAAGPAMGIWLLSRFSFTPLFAASGFMIGVALLIAFFIRYPKQPAVKRKLSLNSFFERRILSVALLVMCTSSMFSGVIGFISVYSMKINVGNAGLFFIINSIGVVLTRLFAGRIQDRSGPKPVIVFGYIMMACGFAMLSISRDLTMLYIAALLIGLGNGSVTPAMQAMVIDMVEPSRRGVATSTHLAALDIGIAGGSIILGWIAELTSFRTMYMFSAVFLLLPLLLFLVYTQHDYKKKAAAVEHTEENLVYPSR